MPTREHPRSTPPAHARSASFAFPTALQSVSSYTVTVTAGSQPAWVSGQDYSNGQLDPNFTQQTLATGNTLRLPATGAILVHIGANGTTIKLYNGFVEVATVPTPPGCPCYLLFEPAHH